MILEELVVGPIMSNCFILGCEKTKEAAVIDPGADTHKILLLLADLNLKLKYIINTHGHFDHVAGNKKLKDATGAKLIIHPLDEPMLAMIATTAASWGLSGENSPPPDRTVEEGETISFGEITLKVIHTPGHSRGGISLYTDGVAFVGDTLFAGSIGRTDFPGGDYGTLIASIKDKLFALGDDVRVYTGHGPATSIGLEKRVNPFVGEI